MFAVTTVRNGSTGASVKLLQRLLKSYSYTGRDGKQLTIDGEAGTNTVYAIKRFQKDKGLTQDGIAGPNTWKALLGV